jgi:predicted AlkP superfamily pyrophosphatase or phosphodiesterase
MKDEGKRRWWVVVLIVTLFTLVGFGTVLFLGGWHWPVSKHKVTSGPALLLISIDGLGLDMLSPTATPNLLHLADQGVMAALRPAYPSTTFPNHFTMITGLRPARHGIVGNVFLDGARGVFRSREEKSVRDGGWLREGEPVWNAVEREGGKSAVIHYVGAGTVFNGVRPSYPVPFNSTRQPSEITDLIIKYTRKGGVGAPTLVIGYYSIVDRMSHRFGPDSPQAQDALQLVDNEVGRVIKHIEEMQNTNLVLVSDHGAVRVKEAIKLSEILPSEYRERLVFSTCSPVTYLYTRPQDRLPLYSLLLERLKSEFDGKLNVYIMETMPAEWRFAADNTRVPSILIQAELGYSVTCDSDGDGEEEGGQKQQGDHGYDPFKSKEMRAVFIGRGPRLKSDTLSYSKGKLGVADTVDVYRVMAGILELPMRGDLDSGIGLSQMVLTI